MLNFYKSISLMKLTKLTLEWQSQIISDQEILLALQQPLHVHNISVRELKFAYEYVHEHSSTEEFQQFNRRKRYGR